MGRPARRTSWCLVDLEILEGQHGALVDLAAGAPQPARMRATTSSRLKGLVT